MQTKIVIIGGGGHARSVIDCLAGQPELQAHGIVDANPGRAGTQLDGIPILGGDEMLAGLAGFNFVVGVGGTRDNAPRKNLYDKAVGAGLSPATLIHPAAQVSTSARLGYGTVILAGAIVNAGAVIGDNVIINTGAIVEHDCIVGDHVHLATRACLTGNVSIGNGAHVGANAVIRHGLSVGDGACVGIGAVVTRDVAEGIVVVGNPAKEMI